jgi:hypothetical protein
MIEEEKNTLLYKTKMLIEKEIYVHLVFLGIDPDLFNIENFTPEEFLGSAPENPTHGEWLSYLAISRFAQRLKEVNNKINGDLPS